MFRFQLGLYFFRSRKLTYLSVVFMMPISLGFGQSSSNKSAQPSRHPVAATSKVVTVTASPDYLHTPFDTSQLSLRPNFEGHDIEAVINAIKVAPSLKPKSEFESTADFVARQQEFTSRPFYGTLKPNDEYAFVLQDENFGSSPFKYDADSQIMEVNLNSNSTLFLLEKGNPTLETVVARSFVRSHGSYIGTNSFGATVEVQDMFAEDYGLAFDADNWLFASSKSAYGHAFTYLLSMSPSDARSIEADGKLLIVCYLSEPWILNNVHGHDPTVEDPYKSTVGEHYLKVIPEQLWVFNQKTGDVVAKVSKLSLTDERTKQLALQNQQQQIRMQAMLRETPLILEVPEILQGVFYRITIDDQSEDMGIFSLGQIFRAKREIKLVLEHPSVPGIDVSGTPFMLNGKVYVPKWQEDSTRIGNSEFINSLTAVIGIDQEHTE